MRDLLARVQAQAWRAGGGALLLLVVGLFVDREQFFQSYLFAWLFCLGLGLGCLGVMMLNNLTGGGWGVPIRRALEAGVRTLPLLALMFLPIAVGIGRLYHWSHPEAVAHDPLLQHKAAYLNVPFFLVRAALYFAIWIVLGRVLLRLSERFEATGDPRAYHRRAAVSAGGLLLYVLTMTFAAVDWAMSIEAHWFSTIYGLHFVVGQALMAFCVCIIVAARVREREPEAAAAWTDTAFNDLGNLVLSFILLWAYVSFSQFLIIWSGNLPEETPWYLNRIDRGWQAIALVLVFLHFGAPFLLLLARRHKRNARILARIALGLLAVRLVDVFWVVAPGFHPEAIHLSWLDLVAPVALGGLWLGHFVRHLSARPLVYVPPPVAEAREVSPS